MGSALLNGDNFDSVTARGTWLVEFFSPYCGHCRQFAPTWDVLSEKVRKETEEGSGPTAGFQTAQVNCITYGDLCTAQKVKSYPSIRLYVDGKKEKEFNKERSIERLVEFMTPFAPPKNDPAKEETPSLKVQEARSNNPINPDGTVLSLNPSNFAATIGSGPIFIKFYAPWCGHCKKLAPVWSALARNLQNKLTVAEVNCDMYSSLCGEQGVEGYPMLFFYREGHKLDYTGKRTLEAMEAFSDQVMAPAVQVLPPSHSVTDLVKEHEVIFLFLHIAPDQDALKLVQTAGNTALASPPIHIYTSISPELRSKYGADTPGPTLIALKAVKGASGVSEYISTATFPIVRGISHGEIHAFLGRNAIPLITELTSDNFQTIMTARAFDPKPLVVILASKPEGKTEARQMLSAGEEYWRREQKEKPTPARDVLWTYMDGDKWGSWLKSMYGIKSSKMPAYVVADHSKLIFYNQYKSGKPFDSTANGMAKAVSQALEGQLSYKHSQNIAQRIAVSVANYSESIVEAFVAHPIWMILLIVVAMAIVAWIVSDMLAPDSTPSRPGGGKLRLGEKYDRRLD